MTEITRLKDVGSPPLRELVREARRFEPPSARRDAILRDMETLGLAALVTDAKTLGDLWPDGASDALNHAANAGSGTTAVSATLAKGVGLGGTLSWKAIAVGATILTAGGGVLWTRSSSAPRPSEAPSIVERSTTSSAQRDAAPAPLVDEKSDSAGPRDDSPAVHPKERPRIEVHRVEGEKTLRDPRPVEPSAPPTDPGDASASRLSADLESLRAARAALRQGRLSEARRILGELEGRSPHPSLRLETEVMTIEMLMASGDEKAAHLRARRFVEAHPRSLLSERLRPIAGTAEAPRRTDASESEEEKHR